MDRQTLVETFILDSPSLWGKRQTRGKMQNLKRIREESIEIERSQKHADQKFKIKKKKKILG